VDQLLARAPARPLPHLRGLVCPHAGYEFSGPTAAHGYQLVKGCDFHTVIVLGPSHYALFAGASVPNADTYQTPLGLVTISEKARQLVGQGPFILEHPCQVDRPEWWSAGRNSRFPG
jgi:AmmeMemoRadiSam system protein B